MIVTVILTAKFDLEVTPKPNVGYGLEIEQHPSDCSQTKVKITIPVLSDIGHNRGHKRETL